MSRPEVPVTEQERVPARSRMRPILALVVVAGLFVAVMFASVLQGLPQFGAGPAPGPAPTLGPDAVPTSSPSESPPPIPEYDSLLLRIIGIIVFSLVAAVILFVVFLGLRMLFRYLVERWRDRPLARREAAVVDAVPAGAGVDAEPDVATIRRGIAEARKTIDEHADPGDGIVAAWVGLEETAADAGVGRAASETPSEFTLRIIGRRQGIANDVTTLLGLYERVRFGGEHADEAARATASRCLRAIEEGWR